MVSLVLEVCIRSAHSAIGVDRVDQGLEPLAFSALFETLVLAF